MKEKMRNFVSVFNPLNKNVTVNWDLSGEHPKTWVLKAKEITKVDSMYEKHVRKALIDEMFNKKGNPKISHDIQERDFYKETEV